MVSIPLLACRASQFFWTLLTTALIGNAIHEAIAGNPSAINYAIFTCVFSWLALLAGLAGIFVESLAIPVVAWGMDGLAALFTLIAGIVLAAELKVHSCGNTVSSFPSTPCFRFLKLGREYRANPEILVIHHFQPPHKRIQQPHQALPRAPSLNSILLVPLRLFPRLHCLYVHESQGFRKHLQSWRYAKRCAFHEPGLKLSLYM